MIPRHYSCQRKHHNGWLAVSLLGTALVLLPLLYIFSSMLHPPSENWLQIKRYLLKDYVSGSVILVLLTGLMTTAIGFSLAWLVAAFEFPYKRFFRWALVLPLTIPPYIAAFTYGDLFSYTGVVHKTLRSLGIAPYPALVDIMSMRGPSLFLRYACTHTYT